MELKEQTSMNDILLQLKDEKKIVGLQIKAGPLYKGSIVELSIFCVRLKLVGDKSFFDAVIRIEDIAAVEVQVRTS